ncbi:MAG: GNAT family N-acetyltransferase [Gammaproteobacteria bacterium]|jgi:ribosomal protein S18 acetylase RimI-like enzyme|nr:GNAT family N-acetyltransferase [Gammaproteobacteria bacterium]
MNIEVIQADYLNEQHKKEIPMLLDAYASDPMGGGKPLDDDIKNRLVAELSRISHAFSVIAYVDGQPAGLVNCFEGFSTFACKPLINIHDVVVVNKYRGRGISQKMLDKVEEIARAKGCCKITLEVLSNNEVAKSAYEKFGFSGYELDPETGHALFWQKHLTRR